jgi:YVTN family beta-propeller protein
LLLLAALALLLLTAPSPTTLSVRVIDADTRGPLAGAAVRARGRTGEPIPTVTTDEAGLAQFEDIASDSSYVLRVQKLGYDLTFEPGVIVTEGQETEVDIPLSQGTGSRLLVGLEGARVAEIDTASLLVGQTLRLHDWKQGATRHVRVHPSEDLIYAVAGGVGSILNVQNGESLATIELDGIVETLSTDGSRLDFVVDKGNAFQPASPEGTDGAGPEADQLARLLTMDAITGELLAEEEAHSPLRSPLMFWQPGGNLVYLVDPARWSLWQIGESPIQVLAHSPTGAYPKEGFLSADGHYRYTWSTDSFENLKATWARKLRPVSMNQLSVVSTSSFSLSPTDPELYVLDAQLGTMSIIDPTGDIPPILIAVGKRPVALVVSPGGTWAYVANRESQTVSVIHLPSAQVVQTIPLDGEPISLAVQ